MKKQFSSFKWIILFLIILFASFNIIYSQDNTNSIKLEELEKCDKYANNIFEWNNQVLVKFYYYDSPDIEYPRFRFHYFDRKDSIFKRFILNNDSIFIAFKKYNQNLYTIVKRDNAFFLLFKKINANKWNEYQINLDADFMHDFDFAVNDSLIILANSDSIYYCRNNNKWKAENLNNLLPENYQEDPKFYWFNMLLVSNNLFYSFDNGEFGGGLYKFTFSINNGIKIDTVEKLFYGNVNSLKKTSTDIIYASCGDWHGSLYEGDLYKYENNILTHLLHSCWDKDYELKAGSVIFTLDLNNYDEPYIIVRNYGIIKYSNGNIVNIINDELSFDYKENIASMYITPESMYIDNNDNIFISMYKFGIFHYSYKNGKYTFKQIPCN